MIPPQRKFCQEVRLQTHPARRVTRSKTGQDLSPVDNTLLDLEPEDSGTNAPLTGISPLTSIPAPLPTQNVPATSFTLGPVHQSTTDSSALFRAPHPVSQSVTQDIPLPGYAPHSTPGRQSVAERMASLSFPQPQRTLSEIPQTPRTQLIRSQLEQPNFEMMNTLQQKNHQQIKDLSAQLQTGLQAFLQQSMEQMFTRLAAAQTQPPAATSTAPPPHIVSITPVSALPPAKSEEPLDSAPSQPVPLEVKKGLSKVKGSSSIAQQSIEAVVSQVKVPTSIPSTQPFLILMPLLQGSHLLFRPWNRRNTGLMLQLPPSLPLQNRKTLQKLENRWHALTSLSGNWSKRLGSSCPSLTQQQKRTTSWAQHWDVIPFSFNRRSWIDPIYQASNGCRPITSSDCLG